MLVFPPCKINIGLQIVGKREDGYHNLQTSFFALNEVCDILEIILYDIADDTNIGSTQKDNIEITGIEISGNIEDNTIHKAITLLREYAKIHNITLPFFDIHLHKLIPFGSGLGGGSADASYCIAAINHLLELNIPEQDLIDISAKVGSDCPFFIKYYNNTVLNNNANTAFMGYSRGEKLEEINFSDIKQAKICNNSNNKSNNIISGEHYNIVLIIPPIHISTKQAFSNIVVDDKRPNLLEFLKCPINEWKDCVKNDFENSILPLFPEIEAIKQYLYNSGAVYASMSGSGSSIYGIFDKDINIEELKSNCQSLFSGNNQSIFTRQTNVKIY